jgi:hypothetical protein
VLYLNASKERFHLKNAKKADQGGQQAQKNDRTDCTKRNPDPKHISVLQIQTDNSISQKTFCCNATFPFSQKKLTFTEIWYIMKKKFRKR